MEIFAAQPNTAVKISGICVPGEKWTADLNGEVVLETIRIFGVERCMFASNFPVDGVVASYDDIFNGFADNVSVLSEADQLKLFHDNAMKYYRPV
jgi:predicted TIM-barrel fold metal-dependent hydrolase